MKITVEHDSQADYVLAVAVNGKPHEQVRPGQTRIFVGYAQLSVAPGNAWPPPTSDKDAA